MTAATEAVKGFFDFLKRPSGLGVVALAMTFAFLFSIAPIAVLTWINYDGTNRIIGAINDLKTSIHASRLAER